MQKLITLEIYILCIFTFLICDVGTITRVTGKVQLITDENTTITPRINSIVKEGMTIVTGYQSSAVITLNNKSTITIAQNSRTIINKNIIQNRNGNSYSLGVLLGQVTCKVTKIGKDDSFEVTTPTVIAGVRGTDFSVATGKDGSGAITVKEGVIAAETDGDIKSLKEGNSTAAIIKKDGSAQETTAPDNQDIDSWLTAQEEKVDENPEESLDNMTARLDVIKKETEKINQQSIEQEKATSDNPDELMNKALDLNNNLNNNKNVNDAILANAELIVKDHENEKPELKTKLGAIERIHQSITTLNKSIDASLARIDNRIAELEKKLDDSFDNKEEQIEDKFKKFNDEKSDMDKMFDNK